jgi:hypothetical protein
MKRWKIIYDWRLQSDSVHQPMRGIARLHNLNFAGQDHLVTHAEDYRRDDPRCPLLKALTWNRPHDVRTGAPAPGRPNFPEPENLPVASCRTRRPQSRPAG